MMSLLVAAAPFLTLLLAALVVGRGAEEAARRAGLPRPAIAGVTTPVFVSAVVTARVAEILPTWRSVVANPLDILRFTGADQLSPLGGVLGAILGFLVFVWRQRLPLLRTADLYAGVLPLGLAVYNLGCLVRGDCYGRVALAPFGIVFPGFELPHYPVALYAAALALFVYAFLRWFALRRPAPGSVSLAAATAIAASAALLAPLRLESTSGLLDGQLAAVIALTLGVLLLVQVQWLMRVSRSRALSSPPRAPSPGEGASS
jgi:phosphatidylglycerol---prolipoprotein diacylglyceryl transferase